jgi:hypothetical protein
MIWLVVGLVVALAAAAAVTVNRDDPYQTAAKELGLKLGRTVPDLAPHLDGMIDGLATKIDIAGGHQPAIRYRVFYPALGIALHLDRETTISRTLGQLGRNDQQIGDAGFDARFRVNTSRPDALKAMLTPELRRSLTDLIDRYPGVVVADGEISLFDINLERPAAEMVTTTRDLVATARLLVANRPEPEDTPAAPQPQPTPPPPTAEAARRKLAGSESAAAEASPARTEPADPPVFPPGSSKRRSGPIV